MSARPLDVASAWSERRATNIVAPIASQSTTASSANAPTIRPVRLRGIDGSSSAGVGGGGRAGDRLAGRRNQPVADAADRLDRWPVRPELAADLAHVDVDCPCLAREVGSPDVLEEVVAGEDDARVAGQGRKEIE